MNEGVTSGYTLNIGGNVRTIGTKADGSDWAAGIQNPDTEDEENPYIVRLKLNGMSLVTSGNYQRYYEVNGVRYHHIIDPVTLMPLTTSLQFRFSATTAERLTRFPQRCSI